MQMILDGNVQTTIDDPLDAGVSSYEARCGHGKETCFSARAMAGAPLHAALLVTLKISESVVVLGPSWTMAYRVAAMPTTRGPAATMRWSN